MDRIKPADCIDRLQGATLPFLYFWQYTVCYCTDGIGRQSGIELTLKVTADLTGTGTKGIHTDNLVRHTLCKNRLTLADCLRIKTAITVTRGIYSHLAILCLNSLRHRSITAIAGLTAFFTPVSIHLTLKSGIQYTLQHRCQGTVFSKQWLASA